MEENKSNVVNSTKEKATAGLAKVVEFIKQHKNIVLGIVVVLVAVILLSSLFGGGKKGVIKDYVKAYNKGNGEKMMKLVDMAGSAVYTEMVFNDDDLEDFYEEYKDYVKSDEWKDAEEELDDFMEDAIDEIEEPDDDEKIKIKKFKDVKKEGKNLWKIKVEVEIDDDDKKLEFYVMKKGLKYYIVSSGI